MTNKLKGCLYGAAVGDALGYPIEFLNYKNIVKLLGKEGLQDYTATKYIAEGMISDDTQMLIATTLGCIDALEGVPDEDNVINFIYLRYLDWFQSQDVPSNRRAPGTTCMTSLSRGRMGTLKNPLNNSKGCGAIMRSAPIGLVYPPLKALRYGIASGVITHGHPGGYLPAGFLSALIAYLTKGTNLETALALTKTNIQSYEGSEGVLAQVTHAEQLVTDPQFTTDEESIRALGEGWVGDEALAIAIYCALKYPDSYEKAVLASVNHSGDSDSTGCITGAIMGTLLGFESIPSKWKLNLEVNDIMVKLGEKLELLQRIGGHSITCLI